MYVRKFEGDTLDEALKKVKVELGPDAIILKTVTNKGLKGAFKKNRIEITAAISEQSYVKKSHVDHVLGDQKQSFYNSPASTINHMINQYDDHNSASTKKSAAGYGNLGLNKVVNTVSKTSKIVKNSLDDFLNEASDETQVGSNFDDFVAEENTRTFTPSEEQSTAELDQLSIKNSSLENQVNKQKIQIDVLEKKLFELSEKLTHENVSQEKPKGITYAKNTLRALDISEKIIGELVKKLQFELSNDEVNDIDTVYDFLLRELNSMIKTELPLFSTKDKETGTITVLLSENSTGQTSMAQKMAILQEGAHIICFREDGRFEANDLAVNLFHLEVFNTASLAELMAQVRKSHAENKNIIIDLKLSFKDSNESKKYIETLIRSYKDCEFLLNISAIQAENYNRKILSKYHNFLGGVIINYIDQCVSFGSIINLHYDFNHVPLKFFGTGPMAPDDIESATAERILSEMFNL